MLDRARDPRAVELVDRRQAIQHEQPRPLDVIGRKRGVGAAARQFDLVAGRVDDVAVGTVPFEDAAHVADIVGEAGDNEMRVVVWGRVGQ